jgi:hypothetical protein
MAHMHRKSSNADLWFVLVLTGGTSATFQMWHAAHAIGAAVLIAVLVGIVPPAAAIGLSHVVATHRSVTVLRVITFGVMLAVMGATASASATVIHPIDGLRWGWVLALALDAAELACVWILLTERQQQIQEAKQAREVGTAELITEAVADTESRVRSESAAEITKQRQQIADLEARLAARRKRSGAGGKGAPKTARAGESTEDLTAELRALQMLDAHPELRQPKMGSELGRRLGLHPATGRRLHARLTAEKLTDGALDARDAEHAHEGAHERDEGRA